MLIAAALAAGKISLTASQIAKAYGGRDDRRLDPLRRDRAVHRRLHLRSGRARVREHALLPMLWLSGLFIPLPKYPESWAVIWPAFHLNQVALGSPAFLIQLRGPVDLRRELPWA